MIRFVAYGDPLPKGSARAFIPKGWTRPVITSATKGLKQWEQRIAAAAQAQANGNLLGGPLTLDVAFFLSRPKSKKKNAEHTVRPDLDKLIRGATDALTGIIWKDDSQVVLLRAQKLYVAGDSEAPRAEFVIAPFQREGLLP